MSPEEKYMPLSAEEFIGQVYVADERGNKIYNYVNRKILKNNSKLFHFVPHQNLGKQQQKLIKSSNQNHWNKLKTLEMLVWNFNILKRCYIYY